MSAKYKWQNDKAFKKHYSALKRAYHAGKVDKDIAYANSDEMRTKEEEDYQRTIASDSGAWKGVAPGTGYISDTEKMYRQYLGEVMQRKQERESRSLMDLDYDTQNLLTNEYTKPVNSKWSGTTLTGNGATVAPLTNFTDQQSKDALAEQIKQNARSLETGEKLNLTDTDLEDYAKLGAERKKNGWTLEDSNKKRDYELGKLSEDGREALFDFVEKDQKNKDNRAGTGTGDPGAFAEPIGTTQKERDAAEKHLKEIKKAEGWDDKTYKTYIQYAQNKYNEQKREEEHQAEYDRLHDGKNDKLQAAGDSLLSAVRMPSRAIGSVVGGLQRLGYADKDVATDTNSPWFREQNKASDVRQIVGEDLEKDEKPIFDITLGGRNFKPSRGQAKRFLYDTGMSMADSAVGAATGGLTGGGSAATLGMMGATAYGQTLKDNQNRGLGEKAAQLTAATAGAIEAITEKVPTDRLFGWFKSGGAVAKKDLVKELVKQAGIEGAEEAHADALNLIADAVINGDHSEFNQNIKEYEKRMSHDKAVKNAIIDEAVNVVRDFTGGFISGGVMGGAALPMSTAYHNANSNYLLSDSTAREKADAIDTDRASYQTENEHKLATKAKEAQEEIARKEENGEEVTDKERRKADRLTYDTIRAAEATARNGYKGKQNQDIQADINNQEKNEAGKPLQENDIAGRQQWQENENTDGQQGQNIQQPNNYGRENLSENEDPRATEAPVEDAVTEQNDPAISGRQGIAQANNETGQEGGREYTVNDVPDEFREPETQMLPNEAASAMGTATTPQKLAEAYNKAKHSTIAQTRNEADRNYNTYVTILTGNGFGTREEFDSALDTREDAYLAGLKGEQRTYTNPRNEAAYRAGAIRRINDTAAEQIPATQRAFTSEGTPFTIARTTVGNNGTINVADENGNTMPASDLVFRSEGTRRLYAEANALPTVSAKRAFFEYLPTNVPVNSYSNAFRRFYNAGAAGRTFAKTLEANRYMSKTIDEQTLRNIFETGDRDQVKEEKESRKVKKGSGRLINKSVVKGKEAFTKIAEGVAEHLGIDIELTDELANDINGEFIKSESRVLINMQNGNEWNTLFHECMGEFTEAWNENGMDEVNDLLVDYFIETMGEDSFYGMVENYREKYEEVEGEKAFRDAMQEVFNDAIAGVFSTEQGIRDFTDSLDSAKKVSVLQRITDYLKDIIDTIRDYIATHANLSTASRATYRMAEQDAAKLRERLFAALEEAKENYQNAEEEGATTGNKQDEGNLPKKKAFSIDVPAETAYSINAIPDNIDEIVKQNQIEASKMKSVVTVEDSSFAKKEGESLIEQVANYYVSIGGKATNELLGDVVLNRRGIKDSLAHHKLYRNKAIMFKAVPEIIKKGKVIDYQHNWKNRGYDSAVIIAPVDISTENGTKEFYTAVIVQRNELGQRFYLHETLPIKKGLLYKTGTSSKNGISTPGNNPSIFNLMQKIVDVKAQNNSTTKSGGVTTGNKQGMGNLPKKKHSLNVEGLGDIEKNAAEYFGNSGKDEIRHVLSVDIDDDFMSLDDDEIVGDDAIFDYEGQTGAKAYSDSAKNLKDSMQTMSGLLRASNRMLRGIKADSYVVRTIANDIRKETGSSLSAKMIAGNLQKVFDYMQGNENIDYSDMVTLLSEVSEAILDDGRVDQEQKARYDEFIDYLRANPVKLSDSDKSEIIHRYGSLKAFTNEYFGKIFISNKGDYIDRNWSDYVDAADGYLQAETGENRVIALADAVDSMRPTPTNDYGESRKEAAYDLAMRIMDLYYSEMVEQIREDARDEMLKSGGAGKDIKKQWNDLRAKMRTEQNRFRKETARQTQELTRRYEEELKIEQAAEEALTLDNKYLLEQVESLDNTRKFLRNELTEERIKNQKLSDQLKKVAESKALNRDALQNYKEAQDIRKEKESITRTANRLIPMIDNPTDKKHVPESMRKPLSQFLMGIDFISHRAKDDSANTKHWAANMQRLANYLTKVEENPEEDASGISFVMDPQLTKAINDFIDRNGDKPKVSTLPANELHELATIMRSISSLVTRTNEAFMSERGETVNQIGSRTISRMRNYREKASRLPKKIDELMNVSMLDARSYFEEVAGMDIYEALHEGQNIRARDIKKAGEYAKEVLKDSNVNQWRNDEHTFHTDDGDLTLTTGQIMSLYLSMNRDQAREHILIGGIKQGEVKESKLKEAINRAKGKTDQKRPVHVTGDLVAQIVDTLTPEQKAIADDLQRYMADECAKDGNEVTMRMYGYRKFTDKDYFPIRVDSNTTATTDRNKTGKNASFNAVRNMSMTKNVTPHAKNAVMIDDVFSVFTNHCVDMATYHGMAMPLADAMRWYNYQEISNGSNQDGEVMYASGVKEEIERMLGRGGKNFFEILMEDLNGMSAKAHDADFADMLTGAYKSAAIGANLRVAIQQPTSYLRAAMVMDPKYLTSALGIVPNPMQMKKYRDKAQDNSALAWWKSQGFYETSMGHSMEQMILGQDTLSETLKDKAGVLAQWGDDFTWAVLYKAAENEIGDTRKDLEKDSEEYTKAVVKRFEDIIDQTQVVDTTLHRAQIMRSKDGLTKMATSFMSEPMKYWNMLHRAYTDTTRTGNKKVLAKAITVYIMTNLLTSAAAAIIDAIRNDDDDTPWSERWLEAFGENAKDNMVPFNMIPFVKDMAAGMAQMFSDDNSYYSSVSERMDTAAISTLASAYKQISKDIGEGKFTYKSARKLAQTISQFTGIPFYNTLRTVEGVHDMISDENWYTPGAGTESKYKSVYKAIEKNGEIQDSVNETIEKAVKDGAEEKQARTNVKSALTRTYKPQLTELYKADKAAAAEMKNKLIQAYMAAGDTREAASEKIDKWLEE